MTHFLPTNLYPFLLHKLLGQMMIVKAPVLPPRQLHNPSLGPYRKLPMTMAASIAMHDSFDSLLPDLGLDPVPPEDGSASG